MSYGFEARTSDGRLTIDGELRFPVLHHEGRVEFIGSPVAVLSVPYTTRPLMCTLHIEQGHFREWFYWPRPWSQDILIYFQQGDFHISRGKVWVYRL